jgi:disulfide bond formation protein DsbB
MRAVVFSRRCGIIDLMTCSYHACMRALVAMPLAAKIIFLASAVALGFVGVMQYRFGYEPCILCIWQRVPYGVTFALAALALVRDLRPFAWIFLGVCTVAFATDTALAIFHSGVELHWWLGTAGCAITPLNGGSIEDLRMQLLHTVVARCDVIGWTFLGLSMANYNVLYSSALAGFSLMAAMRAVEEIQE